MGKVLILSERLHGDTQVRDLVWLVETCLVHFAAEAWIGEDTTVLTRSMID